MKHRRHQKGFTLIELLVFIGIGVSIMLVVGAFVNEIASFQTYFSETLGAEEAVSSVLADMVTEFRSMGQSNIGNYPIEAATASSLTFYSDTDNDGVFDRIRYFVSGTTLQKGLIVPTGNPLQYVAGNEVVTSELTGLATTTLFSYYDSTYTGTGTPMAAPINIPDVRIVRAILSVDENPNVEPGPFTLSRQATIRNLRSNL